MVLGDSRILRLAEEEKLIENFSRECLEPCGYDLRLNKAHMLESACFIGVKERQTPAVKEVSLEKFRIKPGEYVLVETLERVNMPSNLMARILPKSTLFRCGCILATAVVDPGYKGSLIMGLKNVSKKEFTIEKNSKIAQIVFEEVEENSRGYEGRYQGGRVV